MVRQRFIRLATDFPIEIVGELGFCLEYVTSSTVVSADLLSWPYAAMSMQNMLNN